MKSIFIKDILRMAPGESTNILGWIKARRDHGKRIFLDVVDSTGLLQVVLSVEEFDADTIAEITGVPLESAVEIDGVVMLHGDDKELKGSSFRIVAPARRRFDPSPRSNFDPFDSANTPNVLANRHLYLRNPKIMAVMRCRDRVMKHFRDWFEQRGFMSFEAPVLTPVPLYEDSTAMPVIVNGEEAFLTQCVGFYLEAASQAFERVYNIGPSFRGEESRSKRHLMEYWHVKAEAAWWSLDDIMSALEDAIAYIAEKLLAERADFIDVLGSGSGNLEIKDKFRRVSYAEGFAFLKRSGFELSYGEKMRSAELAALTQYVGGTFWMCGIPREAEPFPYCLSEEDDRLTVVADLIMSGGHGALGGTAEKISDPATLKLRMEEKGKRNENGRYNFIIEVHEFACVPHAAFGIGLERLIRWYLDLPHVRDAIAFPRIFRRQVYP